MKHPVNLSELAESLIESDICIIGGGLAGITLAREFIGSSQSVCILEAGGEQPETNAQEYYAGQAELVGPGNDSKTIDWYLNSSRMRCFGGSGHIWGGRCVELDPIDFEERDWVPGSGWPISRSTLTPFYLRACQLLGIYPVPEGAVKIPQSADVIGQMTENGIFVASPRRHSKLTGTSVNPDFDEFRYGILRTDNINVYVNAQVTNIELNHNLSAVNEIAVASPNGKTHRARAKFYVLAAGGIENARLLLLSDSQQPHGLGNSNDMVGRYFNGHPYLNGGGQHHGAVYFSRHPRSLDMVTGTKREGTWYFLSLSEALQHYHRLSNLTVYFTRLNKTKSNIDTNLMRFISRIDNALKKRYGFWQKPGEYIRLPYVELEQQPNTDSRITLSDYLDPVGLRKTRLIWKFTEADIETFRQGIRLLGHELGKTSAGRLRWSETDTGIVRRVRLSNHHIGTTRMSGNPRYGVVDANAKLHECNNLYIAGSSIFPTGGTANPTLTILALAIRLADHLKGSL